MKESIYELIDILQYKENLSIPEIAKQINLSKVSIYNRLNNKTPLRDMDYNKLRNLIKKDDVEFGASLQEVKQIIKLIKGVKDEKWKDFLLGLQETFNLMQSDLLKKADLMNDFHVSEWINGKRILSQYKKFKFMELACKNNLNPLKLITLGKKIRASVKINDAWVEVKNQLSHNQFGEKILIWKNGEPYLNIPLLFPKFRNKHPILFIPHNKKIAVFYEEKISTRPQPLVLPPYLKLDDVLLAGLGIYVGDGAKNRKPKVTNSEPLVINQSIKFFGLFGINKSKLRGWIQLHERSSKSHEEVKDFWLKTTELTSEQITKIFVKKSTGQARVKEYGVLHLEANFILLQFLIDALLKFSSAILRKLPVKYTIPFLQGIFAAEGSIELAKSGSLREVRFTSKNAEERKLVKDLLGGLGVIAHDYEKRFGLGVHGYNNLKGLVEMDIFKYHPSRKFKLIKGFGVLRLTKSP